MRAYPTALLCAAIILGMVGMLGGAAAAPLFSEDFDGAKEGTTAADLGWEVKATPEQSLYTVEKGALTITCLHKPYQGGAIHRRVPVARKGRLEFDARIGDANNRHLSLILSLYGIKTSFHGYGAQRIMWQRYSPALETRKRGTGTTNLTGRITPDTWHHFAIEFDADQPRIEYFVDDMEDPVFIDTEVPVLAEGADTLTIGNYGLCSGTVLCAVDNLRLAEGTPAGQQAAGERRSLVVDGYAFGMLRVDEALAHAGAPTARHYLMEVGLGLQPKNRTRLARLIGARTLASADLLVLNNVTAEALGPELTGRLEEWVRQGGSLLVLGGYFTLGKGGFQGTPLEAMMPVTGLGQWEVRKADAPLALGPGKDWPAGAAPDWAAKPLVLAYHALDPKPGSRVLVRAGEVPLLVASTHGKGRVAVFLGTTAGQAPPGGTPFWRWDDWPALLGGVIRALREEAR